MMQTLLANQYYNASMYITLNAIMHNWNIGVVPERLYYSWNFELIENVIEIYLIIFLRNIKK